MLDSVRATKIPKLYAGVGDGAAAGDGLIEKVTFD